MLGPSLTNAPHWVGKAAASRTSASKSLTIQSVSAYGGTATSTILTSARFGVPGRWQALDSIHEVREQQLDEMSALPVVLSPQARAGTMQLSNFPRKSDYPFGSDHRSVMNVSSGRRGNLAGEWCDEAELPPCGI